MVLPLNAAYGYLWWLNHRGVLAGALIPMSLQQAASPATPKTRLVPGAPDQVYWAIGLGNQIVQANFSLWADVPLWRVYTLVATSFTGGGVRGIMYDASDSHQRQGMAVFYDAIQGTDAASQRAQLRTYVHELGHCFNLLHSWQKNLANPPQPLGPNGGLGDLSWMNYTWKYQPSPPAPGGDAAYWASFPFQFTNNELVHLRHGMRPDVIMGGNAFGVGASEIDPTVFADRSVDHSGLALELRAAPTYALGEPVVIEIKLASTGRGRLPTHGRLHPRDDERAFKTIDAGKALTLRPARAKEAVRQLRSVVTSSTGDEGVDNITLSMVIRRLARAEAKAGDAEKATATLDQMPATFRKKGVKSQVLEVIELQAQREKARLLADFTDEDGRDGQKARPDKRVM